VNDETSRDGEDRSGDVADQPVSQLEDRQGNVAGSVVPRPSAQLFQSNQMFPL
jgi:hypothetical protein